MLIIIYDKQKKKTKLCTDIVTCKKKNLIKKN